VALAPENVLRWVYLARMVLVVGVLTGALAVWRDALPEQTFLATLLLLAALVITAPSVWWTEFMERAPSRGFLAGQVAFDVLLVSGSSTSPGGATAPSPGSTSWSSPRGPSSSPGRGRPHEALAVILYFAVIVWGHSETLTAASSSSSGSSPWWGSPPGCWWTASERDGEGPGRGAVGAPAPPLDTGEILATISTGVLTVDEEGRLIYMNPAAEAFLGSWPGSGRGSPSFRPGGSPRLRPGPDPDPGGGRVPPPSPGRGRTREGEELVLGVSLFLRGARRAPGRHRHLPGHHRPGADGRHQPPHRAAGGGGGALGGHGPRDQEPPGLHPERGGAVHEPPSPRRTGRS
jgi:two-component system, NtrC family, sensor histidine kinase PilS